MLLHRYYVIQSGDYCAKVEDMFGITFAQLQAWNPSLLNDCSNLALNDAYCVHGDPVAATTTGAGKVKRLGRKAEPSQTVMPSHQAGGVPYGWPGLQYSRAMKQVGVHGQGEL